MSSVWEAVYALARDAFAADPLRVTNLSIAAACRQASAKRGTRWNGAALRLAASELALDPLALEADKEQWETLAALSLDAAHLGASPDGMHSWAAAYQRASTTQKSLGAYATHNAFATALARITLASVDRKKRLTIVDPSVGAGNLLLAALEILGHGATDAARKRLVLGLHGVELDPRARELCCLLIWLAAADSGVTLNQVAANIQLGNALTRNWWREREGFDVLLMNPPWESLRHEVAEDPQGERAATLARLSSPQPGTPGLPLLFTAQGTGDRNLFKTFVELAPHLVVPGGRLGALLPAAFASDAGLTELRERYLKQFEIARWTSYENRGGYFPIDSRYKFGLLAATRSDKGTKSLSVRAFAVEPDEVDAPHITLTRNDIVLIGRKYHIIPELVDARELDVLRAALRTGTPLFQGGMLGAVKYRREVDLSLGKSQFLHVRSKRFRRVRDLEFATTSGATFVPLMEGRSVGAYDCFQKSWVSGSGRTAVWRENQAQQLSECYPQYLIAPASDLPPRVALCDVTAATNTRTVIATRVPRTWRCGNTAPVLQFESELLSFAGLGIMNTLVFDWIARRMTSGNHLNKFILEGLVWPALSEADLHTAAHCAWSICTAKPRSGLLDSERRAPPWLDVSPRRARPISSLQAAATLEQLVAGGLGLGNRHLETIFDVSRSNRRGFWRYFDAEPTAASLVKEVLSALR
jgi:hypothetical protein